MDDLRVVGLEAPRKARREFRVRVNGADLGRTDSLAVARRVADDKNAEILAYGRPIGSDKKLGWHVVT